MFSLSFTQTLRALAVTGSLLFSTYSQADIVISSTRVIFNQSDKDVMVKLENRGSRPLLVQTWLDKGTDDTDPSKLQVPFTITPPVFRIESTRGQTLRVMYTGGALPTNKESVFWLNVLEVPPKPSVDKTSSQNLLQLAFKTRIKLFYRPEGLPGNSNQAALDLKWSVVNDQGQQAIKVVNDSAFHVSFASVKLVLNGKVYNVSERMVAPKSQDIQLISGLNSAIAGATLEYEAINDYGGKIKKTVKL
nr:fimbrial chaperone [uncultured Enterobacter sp.]